MDGVGGRGSGRVVSLTVCVTMLGFSELFQRLGKTRPNDFIKRVEGEATKVSTPTNV